MYHSHLAQKASFTQAIKPQATLTATTTSAAIDTAVFDVGTLTVIINVGVIATADADNYFTFTFTEGATNSAADAVDDSQYLAFTATGTWDRKLNATTEGDAINLVTIRPLKRYIKLNLVETGTASAFATVTLIADRRDSAMNG
jgi:hypothetical protein